MKPRPSFVFDGTDIRYRHLLLMCLFSYVSLDNLWRHFKVLSGGTSSHRNSRGNWSRDVILLQG